MCSSACAKGNAAEPAPKRPRAGTIASSPGRGTDWCATRSTSAAPSCSPSTRSRRGTAPPRRRPSSPISTSGPFSRSGGSCASSARRTGRTNAAYRGSSRSRALRKPLHQKGEDGPFGEREDGAGREPEDQDRRRADAQGEGEGGARGPGNRDLARRGEHVHVDDLPQVVVNRHGAVQHAEDGEPDVAVFHRRAEQVE